MCGRTIRIGSASSTSLNETACFPVPRTHTQSRLSGCVGGGVLCSLQQHLALQLRGASLRHPSIPPGCGTAMQQVRRWQCARRRGWCRPDDTIASTGVCRRWTPGGAPVAAPCQCCHWRPYLAAQGLNACIIWKNNKRTAAGLTTIQP